MDEFDIYNAQIDKIQKTASKLDKLPFQVLFVCSFVSIFLGVAAMVTSGSAIGSIMSWLPATFFIPFTILKFNSYGQTVRKENKIDDLKHQIEKSSLELELLKAKSDLDVARIRRAEVMIDSKLRVTDKIDNSAVSKPEKEQLKKEIDFDAIYGYEEDGDEETIIKQERRLRD